MTPYEIAIATAAFLEANPKSYSYYESRIPQSENAVGCLVGHMVRIEGEASDTQEPLSVFEFTVLGEKKMNHDALWFKIELYSEEEDVGIDKLSAVKVAEALKKYAEAELR